MTIKDIHYSEDSSERYIEFIFNEEFEGYCDPFSGDIREQRTKDSRGNWASCQNSYECESNLCSSGECIEIADAIREDGTFKSLFVKIICKLGNLFDLEDYNQCIFDRLGEGVGGSSAVPPGIPDA